MAREHSGLIDDGTVSGTTVLRALANVAASQTDSSLVAAVAGKKIRVLSAVLSPAGAASTVTFNSKPAGAGVAISAAFTAGAGGHLIYNPHGHFETVAGEGLTVTTGAGSTTGIQITYVTV